MLSAKKELDVEKVIYKIKNKEPWYKYYGNGNKIDYPDLTIYELVAKTCEAYPNNFAFEYYGNNLAKELENIIAKG